MVAGGGEAGHAVQLQVALVPSDDVEVVPASHNRWDTPEEFAIRRADGGKNSTSSAMPGALRVALDAGDAVAFNPYGLHRGRYHVDKERRTLMLTYTKSSVPRFDYFSNQPWFSAAAYLEGIGVDAQHFFSRFVAEYEAEQPAEQEEQRCGAQEATQRQGQEVVVLVAVQLTHGPGPGVEQGE